MAKWWERAVFYQIYPRSFMDADGDGVGDLAGIESKLDYLAALGVDALWISPFYPSPMKDFGYDISNYCDVDPLFGDLAAFDRLLAQAHAKGIRIIIDLVINHTSEEHPWFVEARTSRSNPKHDWYIWKPIRRGLFGRFVRPNNWVAQFELASAWWPNEATGEYYLGTFTRNQPEVDWRNPELRSAMYGAIRFWLDRGVDGFRMDVVNWYVKDADFHSNPRSLVANPDLFQRHLYDRNRPETHAICREIRNIADSYQGDRVLVGEIAIDDPAQAASYHGSTLDELHMAFNFELLYQKWSARAFRNSVKRWYAALPAGAWPNLTFSNHDQPRHAWRFRADTAEETDARARVVAALLFTLRGTPFVYYGEELGMTQTKLARKELRDPLGVKTWPLALGRDGERTPMQWSASPAAGFTTGTPWLPVNPDYAARNVAAQEADAGSLLSWYRTLLALRKKSFALTSGDISFLDGDDASVIVYERTFETERIVVALNLTGRRLPLPRVGAEALRGGAVLLSSVESGLAGGSPATPDGYLEPYEARIVRG
jgi:glycosidase